MQDLHRLELGALGVGLFFHWLVGLGYGRVGIF